MLKGKVALVTGSSRGIGAETARLLAKNGASVVINYLKDEKSAEKACRSMAKRSASRVIIHQADVSKETEARRLVDAAIRKFKKIDILINNASAPIEYFPFDEIEWSHFQKHLDVALRGSFNVIKSALPHMAKRREGKIINIISSVTLGVPPAKPIDYVSAKYALLGFSRSLAVEFGPLGITVNCVSPGMTNTDMVKGVPGKMKEILAFQTPMKRLAEPIDVAKVILFLSSGASDYITGCNIPVCGGSAM